MEQVVDESLVSRVERTLWTVWGYVSGAVNRLIRPQFANNISSNLNTPGFSHAENNANEEETTEEKSLSTADVPNLSQLLLEHGDKSEENKPPQSKSSNQYEEVESPNSDSFSQIKQDDVGIIVHRNTNVKEPKISKNNEYEHLNTKSQSIIEDTLFTKTEGNEYEAYTEDTMSLFTSDILRKTDQEQTMRKDQLQHKITGMINIRDAEKEQSSASGMQEELESKDMTFVESEERIKLEECLREDHFSGEYGNLNSLIDVGLLTDPIRLEGADRQEEGGKLDITPKDINGRRGVALKEGNISVCEETHEQVLINNNENKTPHFLEGDFEEAKASQLPEEVGNNRQERLQNTDDGHLLLSEAVEEKQDNSEDTLNVGDKDKSFESPMKKEIRCYSNDLENLVGLKSTITTSELQNVMDKTELSKEHLNDPIGDTTGDNGETSQIKSAEEFKECVDKLLKLDEENTKGTNYLMELVATTQTNRTWSEVEKTDINELEIKLQIQDTVEEKDLGEGESEIALQLLTKEQSSHRALEIKATDVIKGIEKPDEGQIDAFKPEETGKRVIRLLGSLTEENSHSISGSQDVIDEDILDLWLETVMSSTESSSREVSELETPEGVCPRLLDQGLGLETGFYPETKVRPFEEGILHHEANLVQRRSLEETTDSTIDAGRMNTDITLPVSIPLFPVDILKFEELQVNTCSFLETTEQMVPERNGPNDLLGKPCDCTEPEARDKLWMEKLVFKVSSQEEPQPEQSEDFQELMPPTPEFAEVPTTTCKSQAQADSYLLDLSVPKFRITVKNPRVRPPTNPRTLLLTPSVEPSSHGLPKGGVTIGIKLPGLGTSLPVLKKAQLGTGEEKGQRTLQQKADKATKPEDHTDSPKQEEAQHKPRWMPPKHQGFGNPLMLELKTKLNKTIKE